MNKSKKPMTIIAIILIVIGVGIFIRQIMYRARHVQDNFLTKDQVENSVSNTTTVTQQEIASVDTAFAAAGLLYKNNDVEGLKAYIRESGRKVVRVDGTSMKTDYSVAFVDIEKLENKKISYEKGYYDNGQLYIDMIISGELPGEKTTPTFVHTFEYLQNKWYWINFEVQF